MKKVVAIGDTQSHRNFYYILFIILFFIRFFKFFITNYLILLHILYFPESLIQTLETKSWIKFTYMVLWIWNSIIWIVVLKLYGFDV